jgi:hypothetical protein
VSLMRFYIRRWDGSIEHDETMVIDRATVESLEKDMKVLGDRQTIVMEFDPPLIVPKPTEP